MLIVEEGFCFCGWDASDLSVESSVVEPVDVFEGGELDVVDGPPGSLGVDEFGLVEADGRLGDGVVDGIADGSDRGCGSDLGEAFGVADADVLAAGVGVTDQPVEPFNSSPDRLFERVEDQLGAHVRRHPPPDDPTPSRRRSRTPQTPLLPR